MCSSFTEYSENPRTPLPDRTLLTVWLPKFPINSVSSSNKAIPMFKLPLFLCMLLLSLSGWSQIQPVAIPTYVRIPLDSLQKLKLIRCLDGLLSQLSGANKDNVFVQPDYLPETSDLLDEVK